MECNNKKIAGQLPDYVLGQLSEDKAALVKVHLSTCSHCRELLSFIQWFSKELKGYSVEELKQHISSETLVNYADNPRGLDQGTKEYVETHLLFCEQCQSELKILYNLNEELAHKSYEVLTSDAQPPSLFLRLLDGSIYLIKKPVFAYAISALILLLVTVIPRLKHKVPPTIQEIQTEPVSVLSEQTRGTSNYLPVYREEGSPTVRVAISSYWPDTTEFSYTISVEDDSNHKYMQLESFKDFGDQGFTQFILNVSGMPDNRYRLKILEISNADAVDIKTSYYPFKLITKE